jgi:hypothetical protein
MEKKLPYIETIETLSDVINHYVDGSLDDNKENFKRFYPDTMWSDFNKHGFRSEEFKRKHDGKHILFMGCSETQGCGDILDDSWSYILYKKIMKTENLSGYFNISVVGAGIPNQIMLLLKYIEEFGKPDEIFFLTPETARDVVYHSSRVSLFNFRTIKKSDKEKILDENFINAHLRSIMLLKLLESFCNHSGIKLVWSTWWWQEEDIFNSYNFKNYFSLKMKNIEDIILEKYEEYHNPLKNMKQNIRKEDGHLGLVIHKHWAQKFYENRKNS